MALDSLALPGSRREGALLLDMDRSHSEEWERTPFSVNPTLAFFRTKGPRKAKLCGRCRGHSAEEWALLSQSEPFSSSKSFPGLPGG